MFTQTPEKPLTRNCTVREKLSEAEVIKPHAKDIGKKIFEEIKKIINDMLKAQEALEKNKLFFSDTHAQNRIYLKKLHKEILQTYCNPCAHLEDLQNYARTLLNKPHVSISRHLHSLYSAIEKINLEKMDENEYDVFMANLKGTTPPAGLEAATPRTPHRFNVVDVIPDSPKGREFAEFKLDAPRIKVF